MSTTTTVHVPEGQPLKGSADLLSSGTPFVCLSLETQDGNKVDVFLRSAADLTAYREAVRKADDLLAQIDAQRAVARVSATAQAEVAAAFSTPREA